MNVILTGAAGYVGEGVLLEPQLRLKAIRHKL